MNQQSSPIPSAIKKPDPKKVLQAARIMWLVLLIGTPSVSIYRYFVPDGDRFSVSASTLVLVNVIVLLIFVPAAFLIRALMFKRCRVGGILPPATWHRGNLIFWAGCVSVSMFGAIVASANGTFWPTILIMAAAGVLQVATFPTLNQMGPLATRSGGIGRYLRVSVASIGIIAVAVYCAWEVTKGPPEWATHPPPEAVSTQPSQFLPTEQWMSDYFEKVRSLAGQGKGVDVKIYGMQRGVPREDGWVTVTSTGGGFSIAMPGPSVDFRFLMKANDGVAIALDTLEGDRDGLKLRASCTRRGDRNIPGGVEGLLAPYRAHPDKGQIREITMGGQPVYDIHAATTKGFMRVRLCACDGATWFWTVEYSAADEKNLSPLVERFLDSFKLPAK